MRLIVRSLWSTVKASVSAWRRSSRNHSLRVEKEKRRAWKNETMKKREWRRRKWRKREGYGGESGRKRRGNKKKGGEKKQRRKQLEEKTDVRRQSQHMITYVVR